MSVGSVDVDDDAAKPGHRLFGKVDDQPHLGDRQSHCGPDDTCVRASPFSVLTSGASLGPELAPMIRGGRWDQSWRERQRKRIQHRDPFFSSLLSGSRTSAVVAHRAYVTDFIRDALKG